MTKEKKTINRFGAAIALAQHDLTKSLRGRGCGSGICCVIVPAGMHVNGPCRCNEDARKMSAVLGAYRQFAERVRAAELAAHAEANGAPYQSGVEETDQ